jgi:hypothetical protein
VSPSGNDTNDGATESTAVQTLGRVAELLAPDTAVLFEAGQSFGPGSLAIAHPNVRLATYGGTERAEITSDGGTIFPIGADRVTIENLHLSSTADPPPTGVSVPHDDYATVRNCRFDGLGYAVTNGGIDADAKGLLLLDNQAGVLRDYLWWGEGSHHTLRGNTLENSVNEHGMRFYADHVSVYDSAITNDSKTTISAASAEWVYIARNTFASGRVRIGYFTGSEFTSVEHAVFERNVVLDPDPGGAPVEIFPARDVFVRNNVVRTSDLVAFLIWGDGGGDPFPVSAAERIRLVNNTVLNQGQYGAFVRIAGQAAGPGTIAVANSLHVFPNMVGGQYGPPFNVRIEAGGTLGGAVFSHDSWQTPPSPIGSCDAVHMVEGLGCGDHLDVAAWDALDETESESYHQELLGADHAPPPGSPPTMHGAPFPGVFDDLYGTLRPATAPWAAGAVE